MCIDFDLAVIYTYRLIALVRYFSDYFSGLGRAISAICVSICASGNNF